MLASSRSGSEPARPEKPWTGEGVGRQWPPTAAASPALWLWASAAAAGVQGER